jgi:hypothetical protein
MRQRNPRAADTQEQSTVCPRRRGRRAGGLVPACVSMLALACSEDRVDLWDTGADRSARSSVPARWPTATVPPQSVTAGSPSPPDDTTVVDISRPMVGATMQPSPLAGVVATLEPVPPISGGTLAVAADASVAVASDSDRDLVYLVEIETDQVFTLALPADSEPGRVVLDDLGQAHIALRSAGKLARVDIATRELELSEPLCQYPRGLAYSATVGSVFVACADGQLLQLQAADHAVLSREWRATDLRDVVLGDGDTPIVSRFRSAGLLWQSPDGEAEQRPPELSWPALNMSASSDAAPSLLATRASFAFRTVAAPDGTFWMLHERVQVDEVRDDDYTGEANGCGPVVQPALTHFGATAEPIAADSLQLHATSAPAMDMAISKDGSWLALATPSAFAQNRPSAQLHAFDRLSLQARIERPTGTGDFQNTADQTCPTPELVGLSYDAQAIAVAFDAADRLYVQNRYPARLDIVQVSAQMAAGIRPKQRSITLNRDEFRDLGHEWFHGEIASRSVSCAACHAEGLADAHTWLTQAGPRRTPSLRGGIAQTAPFGWQGGYQHLNTLVEHVVDKNMNGYLPDAAISAIASWLDRLPALPLAPPNAQAEAAAISGKTLFESAALGCATCHAGPQLTNNQSVDVGSGGIYQVPSLLGLGLRAPYMHDGCAENIDALFKQPECARTGHAQLGMLSAEDAANLQAYLLSL